MSTVICPDCGANYPSENLEKVAKFRCAGCGGILAGGLVEAPAPQSAAAPQRRAASARPHHGHAAPAKKGGVAPAVWIGGGVAVLAAVVAAVAVSGKKDASPSTTAPVAADAPAEAPKLDPMKDVGAWKALPESERAALAARYVASTDVASTAAAKLSAEFLAARGETASVAALAKRVLERDSGNVWARETLGHANVAAEVDKCVAECEQADEANDDDLVALKAEREKHPGSPWWTDADATKKVRDLVAAVRKAEERLKSPYEQGVAHWTRLQRKTEIMKDTPALHVVTGPYVIFVSLNVPERKFKDGEKVVSHEVTMADVPREEIERGSKIAERDRQLFTEFYDGWMDSMGPRLGLTRYGPENADFKTLMKVNVFSKPEDFHLYNARTSAGVGLFTRAYYWAEEPRFVTTYDGSGADKSAKAKDGDEPEDPDYVDHVQCHEATHQLVHFYTWDLTRKREGRDIDWLQCHWRPLWSGEGFAEFFSAFAVKDGKRVWMQPLENRMREIWIFDEMVKEKGWKPWRLKEFFTMRDGGELGRLGEARAKTKEDEVVAEGVMSNLFYGKAWSFIYFLWYFEESGKPKYRDGYVEYLKREFNVRFVPDKSNPGKMRPAPAWSGTLGETLGIKTDEQWEALEKEWNEFTTKLVAASRKPSWDAERAKMRKIFRFDKPPAKKDDKPK